jgi:tetratricopeptide (TPR) repeat protein
MMLAPALALTVLMAAAADPLSDAQEAFAEGRYEVAEQLALQAAQPPRAGSALYLAGLARFRAGRLEEALEALDAAGQAEDAPEPAAWQFNRGACLYALGRFEEAERAFMEAAADEALMRVALVNAGFAALDAGASGRAAALAARAKEGASGQELALVEKLLSALAGAEEGGERGGEEAYARGLDSFDAGRFEEARGHFLESAKQDPASGRARLMAGASAYRTGDRATAREDLQAALGLKLEPREEETARDYLDRLAFGLRAGGRGMVAWTGASLGFDSNVLQVGVAQRDVSTGDETLTASPFLEAGAALTYRLRLSDAVFAELSYGGTQRAYVLASAEDYSLQQHRVAASLELSQGRGWRLGASSSGDVFFTGLSAFRGLQASVSGSGWLALDESEVLSTRLDVSLGRKSGLISEFSHLTGYRVDTTLSQEVRLRTLAATAWYRYRQDRIGTLVQAWSGAVPEVTREYVIPFAWAGHAAGASARWVPGGWLEAGLDTAVEWRGYLGESFLRWTAQDGTGREWNRRQREDVRFTLSPSVSTRLGKRLQVSARYDLVVNRSNMDTRLADSAGACAPPDFSCHAYDYGNENYEKHLLTLELGLLW